MSVIDASEELLRLSEDLDSFNLDLNVESMLLDDPEKWSASVEDPETNLEDDSERSNSSSGSTVPTIKPKRGRRERKNYDPPLGERNYFDLTDRDVGKHPKVRLF